MTDGKRILHVPGFPELGQATGHDAADHDAAPAADADHKSGRGRLLHDVPATLLRAERLSIGWGRKSTQSVLSGGIGLSVPAGHLVCLIGPNGSGKSTLLRTLVGLQPRMAGEIYMDGAELGTLDAEERARRVACVFNERLDSGYFSVFDIVAFGRYPYTDARNRLTGEDLRHVQDALVAVGMETFSDRAFSALSDGEKQKVHIARAIAQNTKLLVLDEPTAFLDAPSRIEIFHLAGVLAHERGKAVVVCSHEVDLALRSADELWVMDRSHRFMSGTPAVVAYSGAIGRAFASPNVRFDPATGTFRVDKKGPRA